MHKSAVNCKINATYCKTIDSGACQVNSVATTFSQSQGLRTLSLANYDLAFKYNGIGPKRKHRMETFIINLHTRQLCNAHSTEFPYFLVIFQWNKSFHRRGVCFHTKSHSHWCQLARVLWTGAQSPVSDPPGSCAALSAGRCSPLGWRKHQQSIKLDQVCESCTGSLALLLLYGHWDSGER